MYNHGIIDYNKEDERVGGVGDGEVADLLSLILKIFVPSAFSVLHNNKKDLGTEI